MQKELAEFYSCLSEKQQEILLPHLKRRFEYRKDKKRLNIVFDILHRCDNHCIGCGTDAGYTSEPCVRDAVPAFKQIETAFSKIKTYSDEIKMPVYMNIGGGEPFLRTDILDVLRMAFEYFGADGVGIDTNGSLDNSYELISEAMKYISYAGVSINGLREYHNWWSGNNHIDAFERSTTVIAKLCANTDFRRKLEITSVATRKNMNELPQLMELLHGIGVSNYSVHRAVPVGRMKNIKELVPDAKEYLTLLIAMLEKSLNIGLTVHLHHSIEAIHATLLLGLNTYCGSQIGNPDPGSSLGIDSQGNLVFDPWCTSGFWRRLSAGNIFADDVEISDLIQANGSALNLAKKYTASPLRCYGCQYPCSGGSRVVAAANILNGISGHEIDDAIIFDAMKAIDPACPLYCSRI